MAWYEAYFAAVSGIQVLLAKRSHENSRNLQQKAGRCSSGNIYKASLTKVMNFMKRVSKSLGEVAHCDALCSSSLMRTN